MKLSWVLRIFVIGFALYLLAANLNNPVKGVHQVRQVDTLYQGYSICTGESTLLVSKILDRKGTSGISMGEPILIGYLFAIPCFLGFGWQEWWPSLLAIFFTALCALLFIRWVSRRFPWALAHSYQRVNFFLMLFFSNFALSYLVIPIPDFFALFIFLLALEFEHQKSGKFLSPLLFTVSFLIRPYLFPVIILFQWRKTQVAAFVMAVIAYLGWYWAYIPGVSEVGNYSTGRDHMIWKDIVSGLEAIVERFSIEILGIVLLWPIIKGFKKTPEIKKLLVYTLGACVFLLALKSQHLYHHGYYFLACFVFLSLAAVMGLSFLSEKQSSWIITLFVILGLAHTHHLYRKDGSIVPELLAQKAQLGIKPEDPIASFTGIQDPKYLYLMKQTGWSLDPSEKKCPEGHHFAVTIIHSRAQLMTCQDYEAL